MSEEFNIFKNLDDLRKTNILDQLKSLETTDSVDLNDSQGLGNDDFDFDSLVDSNRVKITPTKRQQKNDKGAQSHTEKKSKKKSKMRRRSKSSDGSISPTMPLFENLSKEVEEMPVTRSTRRSVRTRKKIETAETILEKEPSTSKEKAKSKGKSGTRGRGRGRGRPSANASNNISLESSESSQHNTTLPSSVEVSAHKESDNNLTLNIMERLMQRGRSGRQRVMRGRRQCLAEIAARSTQVDYVDLVSSPMPRVEGFIDLGSDTEEPIRTTRSKKRDQELFSNNSLINKNNNSTVAGLDVSFDEDNPEFNIKVNWKGKLEIFKLRKHQKFSIIFEQLAEREHITTDNIVFNLNDRIIMSDDTPDSINYKIFHFIDGMVLTYRFNTPRVVNATAAGKKRDANQITLKVQSDKWKRPLQINIMKTDKFRILYIKCAEELKVGVDQLKLSFDGELLDLNGTPSDLDLEGGEAIDLRIKD